MNPARFNILIINTIVANQGICHGHHLTAVGRIRQYLLITGHAGVKNHLPNAFAMAGKGTTREYRTIF